MQGRSASEPLFSRSKLICSLWSWDTGSWSLGEAEGARFSFLVQNGWGGGERRVVSSSLLERFKQRSDVIWARKVEVIQAPDGKHLQVHGGNLIVLIIAV